MKCVSNFSVLFFLNCEVQLSQFFFEKKNLLKVTSYSNCRGKSGGELGSFHISQMETVCS